MKKQSTSLFSTMSKEQIENLTVIVSETLANGYSLSPAKKFTTADLWNIQRQVKTRTRRKFSF